jgi:hypothetical protein
VRFKFAWREVVSDAECSDYHFVTRSGRPCAKGEQGLVAAHVVAKTNSQGDYWLWGTFSHARNVDGKGAIAPLFRDTTCTSCQDNVCPEAVRGVRKTQVARLTPIAPEVARTKARGLAGGHIPTRLADYDLIGSQRLPGIASPHDEPLPLPRPGTLSNEIIEWDRQQSSCIGCHSRARVVSAAHVADFCKGGAHFDAQPCKTSAGLPGVCEGEGQSDCGACRQVQRAARFYDVENARPYPFADMAWTYDSLWKKELQLP